MQDSICRTCGFTDCPSIAEGGPCPRWAPPAASDADLEARFDRLYREIMRRLDAIDEHGATWTGEYRAERRAIQALEVEMRQTGIELARRLDARIIGGQ